MPEQVTPPSAIRPTADERIVRCPACGGDSVYSPRNRFRPFCSERCRQVDLGAWASEDFRMPVDAKPDAEFGDPRLLKVPSSGHF